MESWVVGARATRACLQSSRTGAGEGQCHYEKNYEVGLLSSSSSLSPPGWSVPKRESSVIVASRLAHGRAWEDISSAPS